MKTAVVFPGQGAQKVGMGANHYESNEAFAAKVDQANNILGYDLKTIMFEGPAEKLKRTEFTQPSIFTHSVALFSTLNITPGMTAGHSLGEFSALVAAGALSFTDALKVVSTRGQLMQQAGDKNPGTMAALIGLDDDVVEKVCAEATEATGKEVIAANYNCPGQVVISGAVEAVDKAVALANEEGCRLAKKLTVSGAFHSSLMDFAYEGLKEELEKVAFKEPECPIYSNYTAEAASDPQKIKENVLKQLLNPVRWTQTLLNMEQGGAERFVEVGPGKVLQGLAKRTLDDVEIDGYS